MAQAGEGVLPLLRYARQTRVPPRRSPAGESTVPQIDMTTNHLVRRLPSETHSVRERYDAVRQVAREIECACGHPADYHHLQLLGSNNIETCDSPSTPRAYLSTCRCRRLTLPPAAERYVEEWIVARRVEEAFVG
jgi:hypothetical protein